MLIRVSGLLFLLFIQRWPGAAELALLFRHYPLSGEASSTACRLGKGGPAQPHAVLGDPGQPRAAQGAAAGKPHWHRHLMNAGCRRSPTWSSVGFTVFSMGLRGSWWPTWSSVGFTVYFQSSTGGGLGPPFSHVSIPSPKP